jgi:hypothetical protein
MAGHSRQRTYHGELTTEKETTIGAGKGIAIEKTLNSCK